MGGCFAVGPVCRSTLDHLSPMVLAHDVHRERDESTVHRLPVALLEAQARSIGLPLRTVPLGGAGLDG